MYKLAVENAVAIKDMILPVYGRKKEKPSVTSHLLDVESIVLKRNLHVDEHVKKH